MPALAFCLQFSASEKLVSKVYGVELPCKSIPAVGSITARPLLVMSHE